jgi:hypothetical protein
LRNTASDNAGGLSWIFKLIANGDYEAMTKLAKQFVDAVK